MAHRSESSHSHSRLRQSEYYDDVHSRPRSGQSGRHHHHHHHSRRPSSSYDDLDADYNRQHKRDHSSRPRPTSYHPPSRPEMYSASKSAYATVPEYQQMRHSSSPSGIASRRRRDDDTTSEYSDSDPPRHAHLSRSKRHSTFPPSSYYNTPQQKQIQPYQRPYVHPALPPQPPQSPILAVAPAHRTSITQYTPHANAEYEAPKYTYQPPMAEPPRPHQPVRAESWAQGDSTGIGSNKHGLSRKGSRSVPPSSRASHDEARNRADTPPGPWEKAKKVYNSQTANNTAELALFGLLAVAKAL